MNRKIQEAKLKGFEDNIKNLFAESKELKKKIENNFNSLRHD
jgi:hypothetical protein